MKTLKVFLITVISLTFTASIIAQKGPRKGIKKNNLEQMKSELDLSAEQVATLEKVEKENRTKFKAIRENDGLSKEEKREAMKSIREETKSIFDQTLTEEQKIKLKEIKTNKRAEHKSKMHERKAELKQKKAELKVLRAEFDTQIEEADRQKIAALRTVLNKERAQTSKMHSKNMEKRLSEEEMEALREERKAKKEAFRTEYAEEIAEMKALGEKYKSQVKSFLEEKGDFKSKEKAKRKEKSGIKGKKKMNKGGGHAKAQGGDKVSRFLLMEFETDEDSVQESLAGKLKVYPNPGSNWTNVDYEVRSEGNVTVQIRDEQGNTVKTLVNEASEVGQFTIEFNSSTLGNKNYFIVVTDNEGVTSKPFVNIK